MFSAHRLGSIIHNRTKRACELVENTAHRMRSGGFDTAHVSGRER